jgi:phage/plasmid-associated DNA primase
MVLIAANEEIATSDHTAGLQRRRITMRFDHQVPPGQRRDLEREFKPCLPGVVAWALALSDDRVKQLLVETDQYVPNVGKFTLKTLQATNPLV